MRMAQRWIDLQSAQTRGMLEEVSHRPELLARSRGLLARVGRLRAAMSTLDQRYVCGKEGNQKTVEGTVLCE